jgi:CVNH domain
MRVSPGWVAGGGSNIVGETGTGIDPVLRRRPMPIGISSSRALFSLAAAVLFWLAFGGLSPAIAACPPGTVMDNHGNCLCPPNAKPGQCMVQPFVPHGGEADCRPLPGSYQRSCVLAGTNCKTGTLSALCKTRQGSQNQTTLDPTGCVGDIANMDGQLHCSKGGPPPGGSYTQSCQDIWVEGGVLHAQCKTRSGQWNQSAGLTYAPCRNGVENIDGHLRCQ